LMMKPRAASVMTLRRSECEGSVKSALRKVGGSPCSRRVVRAGKVVSGWPAITSSGTVSQHWFHGRKMGDTTHLH
jgi:hypothetical protein